MSKIEKLLNKMRSNPQDWQIKYPFEIRPLSDDDGGGYLITFSDLPGCISDGETIEEAITNGIDAVHSWIETAKEFNDSIRNEKSKKSNNDKLRLPCTERIQEEILWSTYPRIKSLSST